MTRVLLAHKTLVSDFRSIDPHQARVVLVEALPRILTGFPEDLARKAHTALTRLGIEVRTKAPVEAMAIAPGMAAFALTQRWSMRGLKEGALKY